MHSLAGFVYIFLAEGFCSGVPVSRVVNDQIVYGQPLTTAQVLDTAVVGSIPHWPIPASCPATRSIRSPPSDWGGRC